MTNKDRFYKTFFSLCIVLVIQNIIVISINLADNVMLGGYSEISLSGAAAVNQIQFVFQQLVMAAGEGIVIIGSQYWGKGETTPVKRLTSTAMRLVLVFAVLLFLAVSLFPYQAIKLFTNNEQIIGEGVRYIGIIRFTYIFFAITIVTEAMLRCAEMVKIALYLSAMTFCVNCGINFVLIYGRFGFPQMGIRGAAIGTLTARILECIVVLIYAARKSHKISYRLTDLRHENRELRKDYYHTIGSMLAIQGLWGLNNAVQTMILGHLTDSAIAASSISSTLFLLLKSMAVGSASAASIIIGKTIGAGKLDVVKGYAKRLQVIFVCAGLVFATALFFLRIPVLRLYDLSKETEALANTFLMLQSVIYLGMSYQMPVNMGIIRGAGSTGFVAKLDIISIWGIVIPISCLMAFVVKASPVVVFCCLNADQIFKGIPAFLKVNYGNWIKQLTREVT